MLFIFFINWCILLILYPISLRCSGSVSHDHHMTCNQLNDSSFWIPIEQFALRDRDRDRDI